MTAATQKVLERNKLDPEMVDYVIAHQANKRILDATQTRANLNKKKFLTNIEHYGNTTAATLPLLMRDFENQFKIGDKLLLQPLEVDSRGDLPYILGRINYR